MAKKKALVAMSGGVDSAVAALLLKDDFDLTGITMRLWSRGEILTDSNSISPDQNSIDAKAIADRLGFPHQTVALGESFRKNVIDTFIADYRNGRTPNPCVECNKHLKFGKLFDIADEKNIPFLATGHYANIIKDGDEYLLKKATDASKDQSYFLWSIKRERLPYILFPLGSYTKAQIRELAAENSFDNARRSDSQDICFIPDGDYISFIEKYDSPDFKEGNFINTNGKILGRHGGIEKYTVGQRKGLGIALGVPMFVGSKNRADNTVTLCSDRELYGYELTAASLNFLVNHSFESPTRLEAKIRYRHTPAVATVERIDEDKLSVRFDLPQRAISPGQSLALYDGDTLIGGGIIQ